MGKVIFAGILVLLPLCAFKDCFICQLFGVGEEK